VRYRLPDGGVPHTDEVMARGVLLPLSHALDDDTLDFVTGQVEDFLRAEGRMPTADPPR
jgi:dTDP-4-amino-4,6-dideoxygalactose transaminase